MPFGRSAQEPCCCMLAHWHTWMEHSHHRRFSGYRCTFCAMTSQNIHNENSVLTVVMWKCLRDVRPIHLSWGVRCNFPDGDVITAKRTRNHYAVTCCMLFIRYTYPDFHSFSPWRCLHVSFIRSNSTFFLLDPAGPVKRKPTCSVLPVEPFVAGIARCCSFLAGNDFCGPQLTTAATTAVQKMSTARCIDHQPTACKLLPISKVN